MPSRPRKAITAVALILVFSVLQIPFQISMAGTGIKINELVPTRTDSLSGKLSTHGKQPITVNGSSAATGTTIFSGANIETPAGVGATVNLGRLGSLDLAPNTVAQLDFSEGNVKVRVVKGCVILRTKKDTSGTVETSQGMAGTTDKADNGVVDICLPEGAATPVVGQGAAANAGAGAGGGAGGAAATTGGAAGGGAGGGMATGTGVVIGAAGFGALMTAAIIVPCRRGRNPSPGEPRGRNDECR